jgi:CubicO group peptidase (beta-lactamase class C family)
LGRSVCPRPALIRLLLALALAITHIASPSTQPADLAGKLAAIEKQVEEKRRELGLPGVALAIVKDDQVILQKGFGLRDVERKLPVTADTLFVIGSNTKSFTAMAAVISQDEGKLSLEDSRKKCLPSFRLQDPEADAKVTVRDLLLHRSGMKVNDFVWFPGILNRNELIKLVGLAKPTAKLREKFQYQNIGYTTAGEVVGRANGTTWERFIEERIFRPLGMASSHASITLLTKARDHATGYDVEDKTKVTVDTAEAVITGLSTLARAVDITLDDLIATVDYENQGATEKIVTYAQAPDSLRAARS